MKKNGVCRSGRGYVVYSYAIMSSHKVASSEAASPADRSKCTVLKWLFFGSDRSSSKYYRSTKPPQFRIKS